MKTASALSALALVGQTLAAPSPLQSRATDWTVAFWQSITCTSTGTGTISGSDTKCHKIPDYGFTASFDYKAKNSNYHLHLYQNDDCSGSEESYSAIPNQAECTTTGTYKSFKVNQHVTKRDMFDLLKEDRHIADLEKRLEFNVNMAFGAAIASATFAYMAAGTCPATASEDDVNKTQCGISAVTSVFAGFFAAYQVGGLIAHNGPTAKRNLILPQNDLTLLDGHSLTVNHMGDVTDEAGVAWPHYSISAHHIDDNVTHNSVLKVHPTENKQVIMATDANDHSLEKRAATVTAYYAWHNEDKYYYRHTGHGGANYKKIAVQTWNHGHTNNLSSFCADVQTVKSAHKWDQGYFAMITGTFTDYSNQC